VRLAQKIQFPAQLREPAIKLSSTLITSVPVKEKLFLTIESHATDVSHLQELKEEIPYAQLINVLEE